MAMLRNSTPARLSFLYRIRRTLGLLDSRPLEWPLATVLPSIPPLPCVCYRPALPSVTLKLSALESIGVIGAIRVFAATPDAVSSFVPLKLMPHTSEQQ